MEEKVIKELKGHSGSKIYLMSDDYKKFVRKVGNTKRNYERLTSLAGYYPVPNIYEFNDPVLDMEYIHGLDIKNYLLSGSTQNLTNFLLHIFISFANSVVDKDYTEVYNKKLEWVDKEDLPFTKDELIAKLPKILPQSQYHGDLTLENVLHSNNDFYMIDAVTIEYDSYIFDIAKLRQDLECKWFLRDTNLMLDVKLSNIQKKILKQFPLANNDYMLILMLLRVYLHTKPGDFERQFIMKEINRLWK